jgi:inner membrane protein
MHRQGHYGVALVAYAPVVTVLVALDALALAGLGGLVVVGGAMLPDVDQRVPGVTHRGVTHTVWFALAVGIVVGAAGVAVGWERGPGTSLALGGFGLFVGTLAVVAHLLGDVLTPAGIRPFAPVRKTKYTFGVVTAANPIANYLLLGLGVVAVGVAIVAGRAVATGFGV